MPNQIKVNKEESLAIQNIFGKPPGWLLYWGISAMFGFLIVIISVTAFIRYPDKLNLEVNLQSENPPIAMIAKANGEIATISVKENQNVKTGDVIVELKSTLNKPDLQISKLFLRAIQEELTIRDYLEINPISNLKLGVISNNYNSLVQSYEEFQIMLQENMVFQKINSIEKEISQLRKLNNSLAKQEAFFEENLVLKERDYNRQSELLKNGVISKLDLENVEAVLINEKRQLESFKSNMINNEIRSQQLHTEIEDLKGNRSSDVATSLLKIKQLAFDIQSQIAEYEDQFIIVSPVEGIVSFNKTISVNQYIKAGDELFTILPNIVGEYLAVGLLPAGASGTIEIGQKVRLEIVNYPSFQFGHIYGELADFAMVPNENSYLVKVKLPSEFKTSLNKDIPKKENMAAHATIITKDYSLLERLFQNLLSAIKN
jgi:HlyD family secretion protein